MEKIAKATFDLEEPGMPGTERNVRECGDLVPGDAVLYRTEYSTVPYSGTRYGFVVLELSEPWKFAADYLGMKLGISDVRAYDTREEALLESESLGKRVVEAGFVPDFDFLEKHGILRKIRQQVREGRLRRS